MRVSGEISRHTHRHGYYRSYYFVADARAALPSPSTDKQEVTVLWIEV